MVILGWDYVLSSVSQERQQVSEFSDKSLHLGTRTVTFTCAGRSLIRWTQLASSLDRMSVRKWGDLAQGTGQRPGKPGLRACRAWARPVSADTCLSSQHEFGEGSEVSWGENSGRCRWPEDAKTRLRRQKCRRRTAGPVVTWA